MSGPFKREERYIVLKLSDLEAANLSGKEIDVLSDIRYKVMRERVMRGAPTLRAVVVESDWPEYEAVWKMIKNRVKAEKAGEQ